MSLLFHCCDDDRRAAVERHGALNGIDWLEVVDHDAAVEADRQRFLRVHFVKPPGGLAPVPANARITGGERIRDVPVVGTSFDGDVLVVEVATPGDFSIYTLRLVDATDATRPMAGMDPVLAEIAFSFKVECETDFDCPPPASCPSEPAAAPEIDYLARDFPALRQLVLDRLSTIHPTWTDRNPADLGIALVELLAYVGDRLSYEQDAVATESYIGTARRRVSVRRHARLVDYRMHDGCNARTWLHFEAGADDVLLPRGTPCLTPLPGTPRRLPPAMLSDLLARRPTPLVFETMHDARLFAEQNEMHFYTWGGTRCCLARGATRATLVGHLTSLTLVEPDEIVLVLEEVSGATTGESDDRNPTHRHAVRLTRVRLVEDPLGGQLEADPLLRSDDAVPITEIEWRREDALPFPLCISVVSDGALVEDVAVARGNIALADHGLTGPAVELEPRVPASRAAVAMSGVAFCAEAPRTLLPLRFAPALPNLPLTMASPYDHEDPPPASATLRQDPAAALGEIELRTGTDPLLPVWRPVADLLAAGPTAEAFVVELEEDGMTTLRFGDGAHGRRPPEGEAFTATYRRGTGAGGNLGAEALAHVLSADSGVIGVRNPLPALGGVEPESKEHARTHAPSAFRTRERAVTPDDYADLAQGAGHIQRARAAPRWTGSWLTMAVTVDPEGGEVLAPSVRDAIVGRLDRYRMAGLDVAVREPRYVPLEIALTICVGPDHVRANVEQALVEQLGSGRLPDGSRALFHPDNFTFGQALWLSQVYAAARSVIGVASVDVTAFRRQGDTGTADLDAGRIRLAALELPRLANDPSFPERGVLTLTMQGGK